MARRLTRRIRIGAGILLALALIGLTTTLFAIRWRPAVDSFPMQGIDVSAETGAIDWFAVKRGGASFGYARATVGADTRDPAFAGHWRDLFESGLRRGAIHVYSLCQLAADQAGNFVTTVPRSSDTLPAAIELDFTPDCAARPDRNVLIGELVRLATAMEVHTGKPIVLKVSRAFEAQYRVSETINRPLWSAQFFFPPSYFARPWRMWQATTIRRIEGASGPVNWSVVAR